jgi:hypothetical protein
MARFVTEESRYAAATDDHLTFAPKDLASTAKGTSTQSDGYVKLFDQYRCIGMIRSFWIEQSDEETAANFVIPRLRWCYDPDNSSRNVDFETMGYDPSARTCFLRPGMIKSVSFSPRFGVRQTIAGGSAGGEVAYDGIWSARVDTAGIVATNVSVSMNGKTKRTIDKGEIIGSGQGEITGSDQVSVSWERDKRSSIVGAK